MAGIPSEAELAKAIEDAARKAILQLFELHPGHYYYCSLITTGEAHPPNLAAWSVEALQEMVQNAKDADEALRDFKWSYADSPYFCFGDEYFEPVRLLFKSRPAMDENNDQQWGEEYSVRLRAMEEAMATLDQEGIFGRGETRDSIVINVEVGSGDYTNTERARRLNPPKALVSWLAEAAEFE